MFASTAIGGTDQAEAITGTGPGTISVGAVTYGYVDFAPRGNAIWTTAGPVSHLFEAAWHYRVSGDTREFSISGTPDDTDYSGDTISVSYNDVGTRGLLRAVYSDQLQSPSPSGGAAVRSVLTLTNISAVSQTVTAFRYVDVDLADTTGGDSAVAIGGGGNHVRINDGSNTLDLVGDNATYRVAAFDTLGTALNDLVVDSFANSGLPFAAGDITLGLQWNAVSIAPGASVSFTVNMDLNTPDTENGGPGEDGDQTFTAADVVVNSYSALTGQSGSTLTVSNAADLTLPGAACPNTSGGCLDATSRALQRGDLLLVYQPQGATLDTASNSVGYGTVSNYNGAGRYEFVYVQSVAGNVITIADSDSGGSICGGGLRFTYAVPGTMVIRVPQYSNLTVNAGASLVAPAWTGSSGGVVAIHVGGSPVPSTGVATVNGAIHADARGFRGGVVAEQTVVFDVTSFVCANPDGAQKGEGIGDGIYNSVDNRCRGAAANGGGGGNNHNSGGGGGANGGFDAADPAAGGWLRGIGVYAPGPGGSGPGSPFDFLLSWALDGEIDPDLGGPNLPQTSRGGGRGGYTYAASRANPQIAGPGDAAWGGDLRRIAGGLGGRPLNGLPSGGDPYRRLYFGGGGGAGESNNSQGGSGGAGGGLAFLIARRVQGTGQIRADGAAGQNTAGGGNNDAPGGGGGGGTVVIDAANGVPAGLSVFARGGGGGNQLAIDSESEGPGGGGGGGVILTSGGSTSLAGGVQGSSASGGLRDPADATETRRFPVNGATSGAPGSFAALPPREGAASPYSCLQGPGFTTPVSNAWFRSESLGGHRARVEFAVTAEIGHAGYWVYAESTSGQRQRAGTFIAAAGAGNSLARNYQQVLELPESTRSLYLADVDLHGRETLRGPFDVGGEHGTPPSVIDYDWSASRSQRDVYQSALRGSIGSVARIGVRQRGMQRISYEQLQAAGIALGGVAASDIAVLSRSASVPRRVRGGTVFGPGSSIEFFGEAAPSLWSRDHYYLLLIDGAQAVDMALIDSPVAPAPLSSYQALVEYAPQNAYNEASPSGDPWYADRVVANGAAAARSIVLSGPVPASATGELEVVLWGGIDWPGNKPDHHVELYFNGQQVASERFDGVAQSVLRVPVTLASGNATVEVRLPRNTGFVADIVHIESIRLRYPALAQANGQRFLGASMQGTAWDSIYADAFGDPLPAVRGGVVTVGGSAGPMRRAYRIEGGSAVEYVIPDSDPVALDSVGFRPSSELWIGAQNQMLTPALSLIAAPNGLFGSATDWLVISHGAFAPALQPLLARRASQGLSTRLVEVSAIYARYSAGNPDPAAIRSYIAAARANMGVRYVLLVGADTTDAPGYLNSGSVSFIPAPYASTSSFVRYAPADPLLADGDGDGVPDLALGRLPVRTLVEAEEAVRKILDYETQPVSGQFLVAAGPQDSSAPQPFRVAAEEFAVELSQSWNIDRVYQDLLGLGGARQALVAAFNNGRSVVSYIGHSGPTRWTFDPLLDVSQVLGSSSNPALPNLLPNTNQPIVLQFACWTTYFVSPTQNTMAQALLLSPGRGASAVLGASVLMEQASHQRMAGALARHLSPGTRIGDALMAAKAELAADADDPAGPEILLGQILLGDPAQQIR